MREILLRGKRTDNGEWAFGYYYVSPYSNRAFIQSSDQDGVNTFEVIPETVGQYTGRIDKHGTKIFEGDIVYGENYLFPCYDARKLTVYWHDDHSGFRMDIFNASDIEVVGNEHDNPELLEVTK